MMSLPACPAACLPAYLHGWGGEWKRVNECDVWTVNECDVWTVPRWSDWARLSLCGCVRVRVRGAAGGCTSGAAACSPQWQSIQTLNNVDWGQVLD